MADDNIAQGTPEWHALRLGKVTASRIADMTARTKTGWGASRANYLAELVGERLTGTARAAFTSAEMQWGIDTEAQAAEAYSYYHGVDLATVAFVGHPTIAMAGCSPDRLVAADGLVEIKCPSTATHIETLRGGAISNRYIKQMHWQIACTGRQWIDFVSFDPRMPEDMRLFVQRITPDRGLIAELEAQTREFLDEVDRTVDDLISRYRSNAA